MDLVDKLKEVIRGEVVSDGKTLARYSRDASLFEVQPQAVVFPKDAEDLKSLVKFVSGEKRKDYRQIYLTARSGGSDMTGGPLGESVIVDFSRHFTGIEDIKNHHVSVEPGVFYRDFEKRTLEYDLILPSFPASREICTVGGMAANNAGGEKTLVYGKTDRYVKGLKVILSDGGDLQKYLQTGSGKSGDN